MFVITNFEALTDLKLDSKCHKYTSDEVLLNVCVLLGILHHLFPICDATLCSHNAIFKVAWSYCTALVTNISLVKVVKPQQML